MAECIPPNAYAEQWNSAKLKEEIERIFGLDLPIDKWAAEEGIADEEITERLMKAIEEKERATSAEIGSDVLAKYEGAKRMLAFVESEAELGRLIDEPGADIRSHRPRLSWRPVPTWSMLTAARSAATQAAQSRFPVLSPACRGERIRGGHRECCR